MSVDSEQPENNPGNRHSRVKALYNHFRAWEALTFLAIAVSAGIAYWQGSLTRQALESGQRAFVVLKEAKWSPVVTKVPNPEKQSELISKVQWQFIPVWENAGNTPAIAFITRTNFFSPNTILFPGFTKTDLQGQALNVGVVGPKATTNFGHFVEPGEAMASIKASPSGTIWGWATYKDILPNTPTHITRFCFQIFWINGDPGDAKSDLDVRYSVCPTEGNCTDDECKAQGYLW